MAQVRGAPLDVSLDRDRLGAGADGGLSWIGDVLVAYWRFDWSGRADVGESRTFYVSIHDDDDYEEAEQFYVALGPDRSRGVGFLYEHKAAVEMPASDTRSGDALLSELSVATAAGGSPLQFSAKQMTYRVQVAYEVSEAVITPVAHHHRAVVAVAGLPVEKGRGSAAVRLPVGETTVAVRVTAEDGTTRTYEVTVERQPRPFEVEVRDEGFVLTCPSVVAEGTTAVCRLRNTGDEAKRFPVIGISHTAVDGKHALVGRDPQTTAFSPDLAFESGLAGQGDQLEAGYGELFSGDSISVRNVYGYEKFAWSGEARPGSLDDVALSIVADEFDDDGEVFYVGLAPGDYTGLKRLVRNTAPIVIDVVANVAATGEPEISGTVAPGERLTARIENIEDPDGLTKAAKGEAGFAFRYRWIRSDEGEHVAIPDATDASYVVQELDRGKSLVVRVSFVDDQGNPESRLSGAVSLGSIFVEFAAGSYGTDEGSTVDVGVLLSAAHSIVEGIELPLVASPDSTASADDFSLPPTTLVPPGVTEHSFAVPTTADSVVEGDEQLILGFGDLPDMMASAERSTATVTVADDDAENYAVTVDPAELAEGESATIRVATVNGVTFPEERTIELEVSGQLSASEFALEPARQTLAIGESSVVATFTTVLDDVPEWTETATVTMRLDGDAVGSASVRILDSLPTPSVDGVVQVGRELRASFEELAPTDAEYQWQREGAEIGGATGSSYVPTAADAGHTLSVRVSLDSRAVESAATIPVWDAPSSPPLSVEEEELLGASLTVGSTRAYPLWQGGYGRLSLASFGSLDRTGWSMDGVEHEVTVAALNYLGALILQIRPAVPEMDRLRVYWNSHRIGPLSVSATGEGPVWVAEAARPPAESRRYTDGSSDGVGVALSIRRVPPPSFLVTAEPLEIIEGGESTIRVSLEDGVTFAEARTLTVSVTGDVSAADYTLAPESLELAAGESSASATFTALSDEDDEEREEARLGVLLAGEEVGSATVSIRLASADATLSELVLSDVDIGEFESETTSYTGMAAEGIDSTTVAATPSDENAGVEIADASGSTLGTRRTSVLSVGENEIAVTVVAEDGETERSYMATVTRELVWGARLPERDIELSGAEESTGVWSDGATVWALSDWHEGSARAYDLTTGARQGSRDVRLSENRGYAALWSDGATLWAASYFGSGVQAYRLSDGARQEEADLDEAFSAAGNDAPTGLWSDGETLFAADQRDAHVYAYDADGTRRAEQEFGLRGGDVTSGWPWGIWSDGEILLTSWYGRGILRAYRLLDGARQPAYDIDTGASGNRDPRDLWSDGETLWVVDGTDGRLYAYAVPGLRRAASAVSGLRAGNRAPRVPSDDPGAAVAFPDPVLRGRVEVALGKAPGEEIGVRELAALESLDLRDAGVRDLTGLDQAVNLAALDLGGNAGLDLRVLGPLPKLAVLNVDGAASDVWALSGLPGLVRLSIRDNGIEDITALGTLTGLTLLDIGGNQVTALAPLAGMARLRTLRADGNAIVDVSPLEGLMSLESVDLRDNRIEDISPLEGLPGLVEVDVRGNPGAAHSPLAGTPEL